MQTTSLTQPKNPSKGTHILRRSLIVIGLAFFSLVAFIVAWLYWQSHTCLPQLNGTMRVAGLSAPVEVLRDARGVPHIRSQSLADLFFAQGYVTAQDRLWQMDINRRFGNGELSGIFGERTLSLDIENRTLGFRQAAERAVEDLDPESQKMLRDYTRGINAFISTHQRHLPIEFLILHYKPRPWREADSLAVAASLLKALNTSWPADVRREKIRSLLSPQLYSDLYPDHSSLDVPVAEPISNPPTKTNPERASSLPPLVATALAGWRSVGESSFAGAGSNNWVLSGSLTRSGKPLLANDPHLHHTVPSVWYMVHLKGPGLDVSGVSIPGLPLVIIGHNRHIAWGMTNTNPDVQDLYSEIFNVHDPDKYLHNGVWVDAQERPVTIKVRGKRDYNFVVKVTRHGPIISHEGGRDLALEWTALQPHGLSFPFLKIDQAQNWRQFTDALRGFAAPMQNFVYADTNGNIGFYAAGWVPIRRRGDGSVPVPGDTDDYDWTGHIPFKDLPHSYNPSSGMIATANGRIVPDSYPYFITHRWAAPFRTARIYQLLRSGKSFTVQDMLRIQTDIYSIQDELLKDQLLAAAAKRPPTNPDIRYALELLRKWDGEARWNSGATLVCEVTGRVLLERILAPKLGNNTSLYRWPMASTFVWNVLKNRWARWLPPGDADFNQTLMESLDEAVEKRIPKLVGSHDHDAWKWGETIPLMFRHQLSGSLPFLGRLLNTGPYPQSGTGTTVKQTTPTLGPSMRMVVDFSNFDNSVQNITLGESGQVFSPYYRDQFPAWYAGRSFPMLFSDEAVDKGTVHKLVLEPASTR